MHNLPEGNPLKLLALAYWHNSCDDHCGTGMHCRRFINYKGHDMKFRTFAVAVVAATTLIMNAAADAKVFVVKWSGSQFGNSATATGTFDINTAVYPDLGGTENVNPVGPNFQVLSLKITGASSGNGTFTQSDFGSFVFAANTPLNYNTQLIGQLMGNGYTFGSFGPGYGGPSGDFNLFASNASAPTGTFFFRLTTGNGSGDSLAVTSIAPGVPEPASWALMIAGFGLVGVAARRRSSVVTA